MGMFDDLIPQQSSAGGMFDDLIPKKPDPNAGGAAPNPNDTTQFKTGPAEPVREATPGYQSALIGGADTLGFGLGDEMSGVGNWLRNRGASGSYTAGRDKARMEARIAQEDNPGTYLAGQVAGGVASAAIPGGAAVKGATLLPKIGRAALVGGLESGAYGAGSAEGDLTDRAEGALKGAAIGAATGAAAPVFGAAVGKVTGKLPNMIAEPIKYAQDLKNGIYEKVKDAGIILKRPEADTFWEQMDNRLSSEKANPTAHSKTIATLKSFYNADQALSLDSLDQLRGQLGTIMGEGGTDGYMARQARKEIDKVTENLQPDNVISLSGESPGKVVSLMRDAREANTRFRNTETISKLIDKARTSTQAVQGGDVEGALRSRFTPLYNNDRAMNFLSKSEQDLVRRIVTQPTSKAKARFLNDITKRYSFGLADTPAEALGAAAGGYLGSHLGGYGALPGAAAGAATVKLGKRIMGVGTSKERLSEELLQNAALGGMPLKRNLTPAQKKALLAVMAANPIIQNNTPPLDLPRGASLGRYLPTDEENLTPPAYTMGIRG